MAFIKRNIHCALVITPGKVDHDPMWAYPLEAVRETLANALCHRDYGAPYDIQVKIFEYSLCISSPGQLPFVSAGAACDSRNTQVSHVLKAIRLPVHQAKGVIRISLGAENTLEDVRRIVDAMR